MDQELFGHYPAFVSLLLWRGSGERGERGGGGGGGAAGGGEGWGQKGAVLMLLSQLLEGVAVLAVIRNQLFVVNVILNVCLCLLLLLF